MKVMMKRLVHPEEIRSTLSTTRGHKPSDKKLSLRLWEYLIRAEHSPIRIVTYKIRIEEIPYCNAMHIRTHHIGTYCDDAEYYVQSQRTLGEDRAKRYQTEPVDMEMVLNVQALINHARVRLCNKADATTIKVYRTIKLLLLTSNEVDEYDRIVGKYMDPKCSWFFCCPEEDRCENPPVRKIHTPRVNLMAFRPKS